jgi:hypothetical protein
MTYVMTKLCGLQTATIITGAGLPISCTTPSQNLLGRVKTEHAGICSEQAAWCRGLHVPASPRGAVLCTSPNIESRRRFSIPTRDFPRHRESVEENALLLTYSWSRKWRPDSWYSVSVPPLCRFQCRRKTEARRRIRCAERI